MAGQPDEMWVISTPFPQATRSVISLAATLGVR